MYIYITQTRPFQFVIYYEQLSIDSPFIQIQYEFGLTSCFHENLAAIVTRVIMGVALQFLCSYITFPLYALVTQVNDINEI